MKNKILFILLIYLVFILIFAVIYNCSYLKDKSSFNVSNDEMKTQLIKENNLQNEKQIQYFSNDILMLEKQIDSLKKVNNLISYFLTENLELLTYKKIGTPDTINIESGYSLSILKTPFTINQPYKSFSEYIYKPIYRSLNHDFSFNISAKIIVRNQLVYIPCIVKISELKNQNQIQLTHYIVAPSTNHRIHFKELHTTIIKDILSNNNKFYEDRNRELIKLIKAKRKLKINISNNDSTLNFLDFLYFSTITQSSTGYGDILPNNRFIRLLVTLQILINVILISFVLSYIFSKADFQNKI